MGHSYITLTATLLQMTHKIDGHPSDWNRQDEVAAYFMSHIHTHFLFLTLAAFWFLLSDFYLSHCLMFSHEDLFVSELGSQM